MMINSLKNNEKISMSLFGKEKELKVFCVGDNQYDENGYVKKYDFELNKEELELLNWFIDNVKIEDYKKEILDFCNYLYSEWSTKQIGLDEVENEINIYAIAINVTSKHKDYYPEICFYGDCKCDEEHGICIGFKDRKFMRIDSQDWIL